MADVIPRLGTADERSTRGQLMLVTALALAILFVTLALIVNTAIYTENLATRGSDIGGGTEAVRYQDAVRSGVYGLVGYANYNANSSHTSIQTELSDGIQALDNRAGRQFALSDSAIETELDQTVDGSRIYQRDVTRNFSNVSGTSDWTVVQNVENVRAFRINVTRTELVALSNDPFEIVLDDGTSTWTLNISSSGTDITVTVDGPSESGDCTAAGAEHAWINVTDGTHADANCDPLLSVAEGLSTPFEIRFTHGDEATGTYSFIVDNPTLADTPGTHLQADGSLDQPYVTHAVYSTTVTVVYQTPQLYYNTSVRVAPGESDE